MAQLNPYESPRHAQRLPGIDVGGWREGIDVRLEASGLLYRRLRVRAPFQAVVEFEGKGLWWDTVRVNDRVATWSISWWTITNRLGFFLIIGDEPVELSIELKPTYTLGFRRFALKMGDVTLYREPSR